MEKRPFTPRELVDGISEFSAGVNNGIAPLLLAKNQLASALNTTVRGAFVHPRPPFNKLEFDQTSKDLLASALALGLYQGGCPYKSDAGVDVLRCAIAGRLMEILPSTTTASVVERTIPGNPNPSTQTQAWLWQSEKWTIWNDGISNPVFTDATTSVRSNFGAPVNFSSTVNTAFPIPAPNVATPAFDFITSAFLNVGDIVTITNKGTFQVLDNTNTMMILLNLTATPTGGTIAAGTAVAWTHLGNQLPPGRMGTYGLGRNWESLVDGKQFVASDIVGGSSGSVAQNYRDAVLYITENLYLAGGGNFTVPGTVGEITAMIFGAVLDVSLGQGPLQVFTPTTVFTCQAPVDRLTWQDVTNPILTESVKTNGGLSQWATVNVNGDILTRAIDGLRSYLMARRDFNQWGTTPVSREVEPILNRDSPDLLPWASSIVFDNRLLMTAAPVLSDQGVYFTKLIALNFDPLSTLRGKAPSVYDSLFWSGLNVLQLFVSDAGGRHERAFAICLNTVTVEIELYELLKSSTNQTLDNRTDRVVWTIESAQLTFDQSDPRNRELLRLADGEIYVDQLVAGQIVQFQAFYKPDQWPCWEPWFDWEECAGSDTTTSKPQFRPRMGLGEPKAPWQDANGIWHACDASNNRPLREGYTFQFKLVITGHCRFLGAAFIATSCPQTKFAKQICSPFCQS